jgi:hypothetical protein
MLTLKWAFPIQESTKSQWSHGYLCANHHTWLKLKEKLSCLVDKAGSLISLNNQPVSGNQMCMDTSSCNWRLGVSHFHPSPGLNHACFQFLMVHTKLCSYTSNMRLVQYQPIYSVFRKRSVVFEQFTGKTRYRYVCMHCIDWPDPSYAVSTTVKPATTCSRFLTPPALQLFLILKQSQLNHNKCYLCKICGLISIS